MVNACCIYGTSLTVKNMYDLLQKNHGDILIKLNLDTYQKIDKYLNGERESSDSEYIIERLYDFLSILNKELSLSICNFKLNSSCCCDNGIFEIFLGWKSEDAYGRGEYSKEIRMISDNEKKTVDDIIKKYTVKTPSFYLAVSDCDYCT